MGPRRAAERAVASRHHGVRGMHRRIRFYAAVAALAAMLAAVSPAAFAAPREKAEGSQKAKGRVRIVLEFDDLADAVWALKAIEKLSLSGVVKGYDDGTFRPGNRITRAEALAMALRLMGYTDADAKAAAEDGLAVSFADVDAMPEWARGYLELAVTAGLIADDGGNVDPKAPALRYWAAMLLVKAAGLDAEAQARMGDPLSFTDAADIPQGYAGYIAVAVDQGFIRGFPDGTVRPNDPITRAQMVALMERSEAAVEKKHGKKQGKKITGIVSAKTDPTGTALATLTLERAPDEDEETVTGAVYATTYDVAADASIYLRDDPATWEDVLVGDKVQVRLNGGGQIIFIEIKAEQEEVEGTVVAVGPESITVRLEDGTEQTYALHDEVVVRFRGDEVGLDAVKPTDQVELKLVHNLVRTIVIDERVKEEFEGEVTAVAPATGAGPASLTVRLEDGTERTVSLAAGAEIRYKGEVVDFSFIQVGDVVEVKVEAGAVTRIRIEGRESEEEGD